MLTDQSHSNIRLEKAPPGAAYRDQIIDIVNSRKKLSESQYVGVRSTWPRLYDLWRGTWTGRFHPHKNNVHIPLIFSAIWADAARKAATSLNMWPIVTFLGYGPDDISIARKREALISAQMKDDDAFLKQTDFIVSADLYGTAVFQIGWKRKREMRIIEFLDKAPISGRTIKSLKKGTLTTFDGPISEQIDLLDFFPQPNVKKLQDMKWVVRRYFLDLDDVRYLASEGAFSQSEVRRLETEGGVNSRTAETQSMIRRFAVRAGMDDESVRYMDKYARPIEILEYWGEIPSELSPDGVLKRVITVGNGRYLFRNNPNPFWHGRIPFISFSPTPDPHYFYAPGKAEIVEKLQLVGNRYLNQSLDAADLLIDPMWFYDRGANLNTKNFYAKPGRMIGGDGNPQQFVAPMQSELHGLTVADAKIAQIREFTQMGTGIVDDSVAGLQGPDRQTAREFIGRREAAGTRLLLESRIYEETCLEPLANLFVALDKQFLEMPVEVLILGDAAQFDPVTLEPIPGSRETLDEFDMVPNYAARAVGATSALSKGMKQDKLLQLLQALNSPVGQMAMAQINAVNFFRGIFREFEVPNLNEIFVKNPQLNQMAQNAGGEQGLGGVPTSGQIAMGQALPQMQGTGGATQDIKNMLPAGNS
jgi:Bacteriophage head to tail connecting protein.